MKLEGKRALVVGLGKSGVAAACFLAARGARVTVNDRRPKTGMVEALAELAGVDVRLSLGGHPEALFSEQDLIVPSPGVPWDLPALRTARAAGVEVLGELEVAAPFLKGPVIGITGTNGKTTTTALTGHLLQTAGQAARTGGNLGTPVLAMVDSSVPETWNVLELSSFQLEATCSFRVNIALVLNVTADHLDRHGTFEAYAAAKQRIFQAQTASDHAVLNLDDTVCQGYGAAASSQVCWFSRTSLSGARAYVRDGWIVFDGEPIASTDLPIKGPHNLENALAAVAAARLAGVAPADIARGLASFQPVEHRLEFVRGLDGVSYYNDSKATNVDAAIKAIQSFESGLWIILGGSDKGSDFTPLREPLRPRARGVFLIGDTARKIEEQLGGIVPCEISGTIGKALVSARRQARPGDTVVLAPACASFDQFENYGHRGRVFKELVRQLS